MHLCVCPFKYFSQPPPRHFRAGVASWDFCVAYFLHVFLVHLAVHSGTRCVMVHWSSVWLSLGIDSIAPADVCCMLVLIYCQLATEQPWWLLLNFTHFINLHQIMACHWLMETIFATMRLHNWLKIFHVGEGKKDTLIERSTTPFYRASSSTLFRLQH